MSSIINYLLQKKGELNAIFTTLSQYILSGQLLLAIIDGQKKYFSNGFKLESITIYHQIFCIKIF